MPTPGAMALLPKAIMLLDGFDDLFEPPVFDPAQAQRLIRIACADFGAVSILTKVIPAIIDKAPHLDFQILPIESDLVGKLSTGEIDFGIFPTEKTSPGIRSVRILESPYRYVVRRGHPLEAIYHAERKLTEEDLARWPNISVHVPPGSGIDPPAHTDQARRNLPGRTQVRSAYILPQPALIAATDLVGIMPEVLIRGAQDAGIAISALSPIFSGMVHRPHLLWHERNDGDTLLRWVMALFVYVFHEEEFDLHIRLRSFPRICRFSRNTTSLSDNRHGNPHKRQGPQHSLVFVLSQKRPTKLRPPANAGAPSFLRPNQHTRIRPSWTPFSAPAAPLPPSPWLSPARPSPAAPASTSPLPPSRKASASTASSTPASRSIMPTAPRAPA
ncbi:MAG: LysR substrate-binding domain-containing protein [Sutterella wadsworthensis]